jgi:alpha-1,2-rhamnosyltransferase
VRNYEVWFDRIVLASDAVVGISKSVADEFCAFVRSRERAPSRQRVGWFHLGADFQAPANKPPSRKAAAIRASGPPYFLSVGTIEPRKGYAVALAAFDKLWSVGVDARYVIVGRCGWHVRALQRRIVEHPQYGRRLFWLDDATDADLEHLYEGARALVFSSFAEGFGLPIIEAMRHKLPVIASDAPIFREIGGDAIAYFDLLDSDSLAQRIEDALASRGASTPPPVQTWREAAKHLLEIVRNDKYQILAAPV